MHVRIQSAITLSNQWKAALKPCGEQSGTFPRSVSHRHTGGKAFSAEELSSFWTHNCTPLPLQPHYSTIWLEGGQQRRRMKNTIHRGWVRCRSARIFVQRSRDLSLRRLSGMWLYAMLGKKKEKKKAQLYENRVGVDSRWNCVSHPFRLVWKQIFSSPPGVGSTEVEGSSPGLTQL